jgi:hypothetical protein
MRYVNREQVDTAVRSILQEFSFEPNDKITRTKLVHTIYQCIPVGPAFQVISDTYNNSFEDIANKLLCVDVYFNDENDQLICMEFVADRSQLTPDDAVRMKAVNISNATKFKNVSNT